jgi:type I site-specific restriction-modification system R (restriction) subunit
MRMRRVERPGLVVDYIGIAQNLKSALGQYAGHGGEHVGIDEAEAVRVLMEKYEIVHAMFRPELLSRRIGRAGRHVPSRPRATGREPVARANGSEI